MIKELSNCCLAPLVDETDICSECGDHCEIELTDKNKIEIAESCGLTHMISKETGETEFIGTEKQWEKFTKLLK